VDDVFGKHSIAPTRHVLTATTPPATVAKGHTPRRTDTTGSAAPLPRSITPVHPHQTITHIDQIVSSRTVSPWCWAVDWSARPCERMVGTTLFSGAGLSQIVTFNLLWARVQAAE
jgi:hypothetical protein